MKLFQEVPHHVFLRHSVLLMGKRRPRCSNMQIVYTTDHWCFVNN